MGRKGSDTALDAEVVGREWSEAQPILEAGGLHVTIRRTEWKGALPGGEAPGVYARECVVAVRAQGEGRVEVVLARFARRAGHCPAGRLSPIDPTDAVTGREGARARRPGAPEGG